MNKRFISIILTIAMIITLLPAVVFAAEPAGLDNFQKVQIYTDGQFTDVKTNDWFAENISTAYELNLMVGKENNLFDTNSNLTVAEAMTIAARLREIYYNGKAEFEQGNPWYQVYADYCKKNGVANAADYDMKSAITRGQFAEIFAKALPADALKKINTVQDNMIPDVKKTDKFSAAIYLLYRAGVLVGNDSKGTFTPDTNIKRVEVAAITTRMAKPSLRQNITLKKQSSGGGGSYVPSVVSVTGVSLDKTEITMTVGDPDVKLTATVTPENATNKTVSWTSSNPSVATVDQEGNVHAVAAGSTTITVTTADGNKTATCAVTVTFATVEQVLATVEGGFPTATNQFGEGAVAWNTANGNKCYRTSDALCFYCQQQFTLKSIGLTKDIEKSGDDYVYHNDTIGNVTFKMAEGILTSIVVEGSNNNINGTYTAPNVAVTGVSIDPVRLTLPVGEDGKIFVSITPENATNKNVTWSSSNTSVATLDNTGKVTAVAFGTATITVTTIDGDYTDTCEVEVFESKTIGEILNEYAQDFPNSSEDGWVNATYKMYYMDNALCIENDTNKLVSNNDPAKRTNDGYVYKNGIDTTITFYINENALTSIEYSTTKDEQTQYNGTYAPGDACLAKGTMITMADGSRELIENLNRGDLIRVFDHDTGKISSARIMDYWQYEEKKSGLITLQFTNNIKINIVTAHCFYCKEDNCYVTLDAGNISSYIGKHFYNVDNDSWETLLGATYSNEKVDTFFIATEGQLNCIAEGMLNVEDGIYFVLRNTYDFDTNMKVDEIKKASDIELYGLFDSSDFEYLTKEAFDRYGAANLKVALGKGIITEEFLDMIRAESITYESNNIVEEYIPENVQHSVK